MFLRGGLYRSIENSRSTTTNFSALKTTFRIHEGGQACEPCYIFLIEIECNGAIEVVDVVAILHGEAYG